MYMIVYDLTIELYNINRIRVDLSSRPFNMARKFCFLDLIRKWVAGILCATLSVVALVTTFIYRNWQYEQEIAGLLWMIDRHDLTQCQDTALSAVSKVSTSKYSIDHLEYLS